MPKQLLNFTAVLSLLFLLDIPSLSAGIPCLSLNWTLLTWARPFLFPILSTQFSILTGKGLMDQNLSFLSSGANCSLLLDQRLSSQNSNVFFSLNLFVLLVNPPFLCAPFSLAFTLVVRVTFGNCGHRHSRLAILSQRLQFQHLSGKSTILPSRAASVSARSLLKLVQIVGISHLEHLITVLC
jgi:hypothetical protein